jgi:hypothetical protein
MATRSTIALEYPDGTVRQIYCHFDGYIQNNGAILLKHWSDPDKLHDLLNRGDLKSLGSEIGEIHPCENPNKWGTLEYLAHHTKYKSWCRFYCRDCGEDYAEVEADTYENFSEYLKRLNVQIFNYILRNDGLWYVYDANDYVRSGYVTLIAAINSCSNVFESDDE